ncbi:MAG: dihydrolipoyl dehydrogenase [Bryobacterales bacterium]|nr:dihydrolipoyl dehydrogenase [Bryobacterales bacterium]
MSYDVIVIGSGPGGYPAAIRAAQYGLRTAVIEKAPKLGGTCLHVGCIPTKALLHTAELWQDLIDGKRFGILCENLRLDYPKLIDRKNEVVAKHAKGIEFLFRKNKVEWIRGFGRLLGGGKVEVTGADGAQVLEARHIVIATGSEARMLPGLEPDPEFVLTNIEILEMRQIPRTLAIVGAGAVGVEFASMFRRFGSEVMLFEIMPRIVPLEDEEISKELERAFRKTGIRVETGATVENIQRTGDGVGFCVKLASGKREDLRADKILIAVGRKPNTEGIGLENTRVETERGYIKVNAWMQTAEPGVYAIGDVVAGHPMLAHAATMEGLVAVGHLAGRPVKPIDPKRIPNVTFTEPGIGSVGLTEAQARARGYQVKVGKFPFVANSKATILGRHEGFVKVVADERFGEILGVHIIGPGATELIAEAVAAMEAEATVETLMSAIHPHPTVSEAVGEAFNAVYGLAINA